MNSFGAKTRGHEQFKNCSRTQRKHKHSTHAREHTRGPARNQIGYLFDCTVLELFDADRAAAAANRPSLRKPLDARRTVLELFTIRRGKKRPDNVTSAFQQTNSDSERARSSSRTVLSASWTVWRKSRFLCARVSEVRSKCSPMATRQKNAAIS